MYVNRANLRDERGATMILFAILLPTILVLGAALVNIGNWWTHGRHLQTKVDAAAFAGGGVWQFPCGATSDTNATGTGIVDVAREYVGPHTSAAGVVQTTGFNPQIGVASADEIHVVVNGPDWWDDDPSVNPADFTGDSTTPAGSVCEAKILDVKATEANSPPLFGFLPLWPDVKRKARIQIEEAEGVTGLLPVAVRIPRPLSAAAVFYNEGNGNILDVKYFREVCIPGVPTCIFGAPAGLGQWTTEPAPANPPGTLANVNVATTTGVVVATSFRAACNVLGATAPCLDDTPTPGTTVTQFCQQNQTVQCFDATGTGTSQVVQSGVQFIRGYPTGDAGTGPPQLRSAYFTAGGGCEGYFNALPATCYPTLNVEVDLGALNGLYPNPPGPPSPQQLRAGDVEVRYRLVRADGTSYAPCDNYGNSCDLLPGSATATGTVTFATTGGATSDQPPITIDSQGNAVAIQIRLRNAINSSNPNCSGGFNNNCRWYYTGNGVFGTSVEPTPAQILAAPVQRSFMGSLDRTGPLKWLRLTVDQDCNLNTLTDRIVGGDPVTGDDAASQPAAATRCYVMEMGLQGGMARDQDEPPIALLLGSGPSQRALVDCDPNVPFGQLSEEVQLGCQWPPYKGNKFDNYPNDCPWSDDTPGTFFDVPKAAPFDDWPAFDCVLTRPTAAGNQLSQGFNQRLFGVNNNPTCLTDDGSQFQPGRNYWHRENNQNDTHGFKWDGDGNPLLDRGTNFNGADLRKVNLFFTGYGSFTGTGTQVQELVGLGSFYITGYGRINGGILTIEDPCDDGANSPVYPYTANEPPPDMDLSKNTTVIWGHFIKDVPGGATGGTGVLCQPQLSFNPCVPVLVE